MDPFEGRYRYCPRCRCEYRPGFEICTDCGLELVDELPPEPAAEEPRESEPSLGPDPVAVMVTGRRSRADLVCSMLTGCGIAARVWSSGLGPNTTYSALGEVTGFATMVHGHRVMVRAEDADVARELVESVPEPAEEPGE